MSVVHVKCQSCGDCRRLTHDETSGKILSGGWLALWWAIAFVREARALSKHVGRTTFRISLEP
eukprot:13697620-Alexandrium_andersonii.AAC.1